MQRIMMEVLLALLPVIAVQTWFYGIGVLVQIVLAVVLFWLTEWLALKLRGAEPKRFLSDFSAPLAGVLFALCLPPWAPWYVSLVGALCAIGLAKHLYGGLGYNTFNPAMVGYAVVLISFSGALARYPGLAGAALDPVTVLKMIFLGHVPASGWDAISAATPLDLLDQAERRGETWTELAQSGFDATAAIATGWAVLLGGAFVLWRRHAAWQVPLGVLLGVLLTAGPAWLWMPDQHPSPLLQLFFGALLLGALFIATDPVSGAATPRGRLLFGVGVGAITIAIREFGAYPDGVAFAVLVMNAAAPLLDRLTQPRVFGR